ncbi:MAG: FtsQ-type POTRA domain-containing protein [Eubacterium sp.]|jgi:cell division protein FtsQ|nr:FtsQ-type POTRA domain-containing protein [Eubacterium sp.]
MPEFNRPVRRPRKKTGSALSHKRFKNREQAAINGRTVTSKKLKRHKMSRDVMKSRRKNKKNYIVYYISFLVITLAVILALSLTMLFPIEKIVVEGDSVYSYAEITELANIELGKNLIRYDTIGIEKRIFDNLHMLNSVRLTKRFPDTVLISVTGGIPSSAVESQEKYFIVSETGRIMRESNSSGGVTEILGFEAKDPLPGRYIESLIPEKLKLFNSLINEINESSLIGILSVDISDLLNIKLDYLGRINIALGAATDLRLKIITAKGLLDSYLGFNSIGTLWVTNPETARFLPSDAYDFIPGTIEGKTQSFGGASDGTPGHAIG